MRALAPAPHRHQTKVHTTLPAVAWRAWQTPWCHPRTAAAHLHRLLSISLHFNFQLQPLSRPLQLLGADAQQMARHRLRLAGGALRAGAALWSNGVRAGGGTFCFASVTENTGGYSRAAPGRRVKGPCSVPVTACRQSGKVGQRRCGGTQAVPAGHCSEPGMYCPAACTAQRASQGAAWASQAWRPHPSTLLRTAPFRRSNSNTPLACGQAAS